MQSHPSGGTTYAIKVREPGMGRFAFLGGDGELVIRRVHAQHTGDRGRAEGAADRLARKNPDCEIRVVDFATGKVVYKPQRPAA